MGDTGPVRPSKRRRLSEDSLGTTKSAIKDATPRNARTNTAASETPRMTTRQSASKLTGKLVGELPVDAKNDSSSRATTRASGRRKQPMTAKQTKVKTGRSARKGNEHADNVKLPPLSSANKQAEDHGFAEEFISTCKENGLISLLPALSEFILEKLNGRRLIPLKNLDKEYRTVHQLIEQTVVAGEGNSILLLGARGCGKTAIVETAISSLLTSSSKDDFHVVRLNGFLHTDDKLALRGIWRQLGRDIDTAPSEEADGAANNKPFSYADTMTSLLALLSHPEELMGMTGDPDVITTSKSVVIILEEFDLFSYHPRQTLLYNLFDIAQARKAPLAVLGLTTKVDVLENLEKRVKSRFSHRYVFIPRPRSLAEFTETCMASLKVEADEVSDLALDDSARNLVEHSKNGLLLQIWNKLVEDLFEDPTFQSRIERIYCLTRCPRDFFASALIPIAMVGTTLSAATLSAKSFTEHELSCPDPPPLPFTSNNSSNTLSLPISLLLSATRLTALSKPSAPVANAAGAPALTLSFPAVYAEYVRLLTSAKTSASASGAAATSGRIWGRETARGAWEQLVESGLVVPANGGGTSDGRMFRVETSFEEVVNAIGTTTTALGRWWRD